MFNCNWNWANYPNKTIDIIISTNEGYSTPPFAVTTPSNISNYQVYLSIPYLPTIFNPANITRFSLNVTNNQFSVRNATVTRIAVLLENGTEINATITPQMVPINSTATFTCVWDWSTYRNKNIVILVYTNDELRAICVTQTP
jgi:hypothetical protein